MILKLVLYIVALGGIVFAIGKTVRTLWLAKPETRGRLNAAKQEVIDRQFCRFCDEPTHDMVDMYESHIGWYHVSCLKRIVG